jgi:hypothetical protein
VAAEQQRPAIGGAEQSDRLTLPVNSAQNRMGQWGFWDFLELALLFWIGLHALPIALATNKTGAGRHRVRPGDDVVLAVAAVSRRRPVTQRQPRHQRADPQPDTDGDQFHFSAGSAVINLGSNFLERGNKAIASTRRAQQSVAAALA